MKYIITEDRLDKVINKFITFQFDNLKHIDDDINNTSRDIWVRPDGKPVIIILNIDSEEYREIFILQDIYATIYYMIGMNTKNNIQESLIKWFEKHMGLKIDGIQTFDNEGFDEIY
jgi:hypothetical protein